jgi:hypothetical protein
MKNLLSVRWRSRKFNLLGLAFLLLTVMPIACKKDKLPQDVAVNPAFEMNPPLARKVSIQKLDDKENNLLVVADFGKGTIKSPYHAIELPSGKVVLRDDGRGVDETAGDGKFSIAIHEDLSALEQELDELDKNRGQLEKELSVGFKGREIVQRDISFLKNFRPSDFKNGKPIPFPPGVLCRILLDVSSEHSLMVVHPGALNGPEASDVSHGAWTFGTLMTHIANTPVTGVSAEDLLKSWLLAIQHDGVANTDTAKARPKIFVSIKDAVIRSGSLSSSFDATNWQTKPLDPYNLQVNLIAIVNRLDLRGNLGYGQTNGGEGRFIFEIIDPETGSSPLPAATIIFEYAIPLHTCADVKAYAQKWYDLKNHPLGSPAYNSALKAITDVFSMANADPTRTNQSALKQIRTNDLVLSSDGAWEMREFKLDSVTHKFMLSTTAQEPIEKYNEASNVDTPPSVNNLVAWINAHETEVLADKHSVPLTVEDQVTHAQVPFLGAKARSENDKWTAPGVALETRHHFSLNTCTGCHRDETGTTFLHVGTGSTLSGFLTGIDVPDPLQPAVIHHFGDLAFRKNKLESLLCTSCTRPFLDLVHVLTFEPNAMVH